MKKIVVLLAFCLLGVLLFAQTGTKEYKIGDTGPGGGLVFYAENGKYLECSDNLGKATWRNALKLAKKYKGGGYDNWYLPNREELNYIYENLRKKDIITDTDNLWSSKEFDKNKAWVQLFLNGGRALDYKTSSDKMSVRAIRAF